MQLLLILSITAVATVLAGIIWASLRSRRRTRSIYLMLDLADELEALLREAQSRMKTVKSLIDRVPEDIATDARARAAAGLPLQDAKRDLLQHRMWIQKHALDASQAELDQACDALSSARNALAHQLSELRAASYEFEEATDASWQASQREPSALKRDPER